MASGRKKMKMESTAEPTAGATKERYDAQKRRKEVERKAQLRKSKLKRSGSMAARRLPYAGLAVLLAVGAVWWFERGPSLPPTSMEGHVEALPPGHILTAPMAETIQRHMLEHADGKGAPGVIIQYNCDDFDCGPDLVRKLTELARDYRANVYLAPSSYDGKIILTRLGRRQVLDGFDGPAIRRFIVR